MSTIPTKISEAVTSVVDSTVNGTKTAAEIVPAQIGGKEVVLSQTFDVIAPGTGKLLYQCSSVSVEDADKAVEAANAALPGWRESLPAERRNIFLKAAEVVKKRSAELAKYTMEETGADENWAAFNVSLCQEILIDTAGRISSIAGTVPALGEKGRRAMVLKEPFGVILAIAPWNATYILGMRSVVFAMAAGNTAVLKAPENSPKSFWAITDVFREAGLPDGVLNCIAHRPADAAAVTKALIENPIIKKINFTGSTGVGRVIGRLAGQNLKPVLLELGGKAPAIVWEDADVKLAATMCTLGAFMHSGQICMSTERIVVHKNVVGKFEEELKGAIANIFPKAGVLINQAGVTKNKALLKDATSKGAILVNGSIDTKEETETRMAPVVIKGITEKMDIYQTESFGPTVSMIVVETEEEALRIANDTPYGLSSAVFTEDLRRGFRLARGIEAGAVHINNMTVHDEVALPHGGMKDSGFGRFGAVGLEEWVRTKSITYHD